jgi:hypothetical protein
MRMNKNRKKQVINLTRKTVEGIIKESRNDLSIKYK